MPFYIVVVCVRVVICLNDVITFNKTELERQPFIRRGKSELSFETV